MERTDGYLGIVGAAERLGLEASELLRLRRRGLEPGRSGRIVAGELVWPELELERYLDEQAPSSSSGESSDVEASEPMSLKELRAEAKARGLKGYSTKSKAELEELLG